MGNPPAGWTAFKGDDGNIYWSGPNGALYRPDNGWLKDTDGSEHTVPLEQFTAAAAGGAFDKPAPAAGGTTPAPSATQPGRGGTAALPGGAEEIQDGQGNWWLVVPGPPTTSFDGNGNPIQVPGQSKYTRIPSPSGKLPAQPNAEWQKTHTVPAPGTEAAAGIARINQEIAASIAAGDNQKAQLAFEKGKALGVIDGQETLEAYIQKGNLAVAQGNLANQTALAGSTIATNAANVANQKAVTLGFDASGRPILATMDALGRITMPDGSVQSTLARDLGEANSRRADVETNLKRQAQSWDEWMKERQDTEALAQNPQSWLQYAARGTQLPQGVGLFDQLNTVNQNRPMSVDAFLSSPAGGGPAAAPSPAAATAPPAGGTPAAGAGTPGVAPAPAPAPVPASAIPGLPPVASAPPASTAAFAGPIASVAGAAVPAVANAAAAPASEPKPEVTTQGLEHMPTIAPSPAYGAGQGDSTNPAQPDQPAAQKTPLPVYDRGGVIPHYHAGGYVPKYDKGGAVPPLGADGDHSLAILQAGEIVIPRHLVEAAASQIKKKRAASNSGGGSKKALPPVKTYDTGGVVPDPNAAGAVAGAITNAATAMPPTAPSLGGLPAALAQAKPASPAAAAANAVGAGATANLGTAPAALVNGIASAPKAAAGPVGTSAPSGIAAPSPNTPKGMGTYQRPLPTVGDVRNIPWLPPTLRAALTPGSWDGSSLSPYRLINNGGWRPLSAQTAHALPPSSLEALSPVASMTGNWVPDQPYLPPLKKIA